MNPASKRRHDVGCCEAQLQVSEVGINQCGDEF